MSYHHSPFRQFYTNSKILQISFHLIKNNLYRKRRKFRGVFNFVIFADATIPRNLILGQRQFTQLSVQMAGTRIDYNAERSQ